MIEAARSVLNRYIPDIYLYSDVYKGEDSGKSPGYALSLLAESTTGAIYSAETVSQPGVTPEDIALQASRALLSEIRRGGCIDRQHQVLVLLFMVLGSEDVGRCQLGGLTQRTYVSLVGCAPVLGLTIFPHSIQFLRDVKQTFGTSFKIVPSDPSDPEKSELLFSCYGTGYVNTNRSLA